MKVYVSYQPVKLAGHSAKINELGIRVKDGDEIEVKDPAFAEKLIKKYAILSASKKKSSEK